MAGPRRRRARPFPHIVGPEDFTTPNEEFLAQLGAIEAEAERLRSRQADYGLGTEIFPGFPSGFDPFRMHMDTFFRSEKENLTERAKQISGLEHLIDTGAIPRQFSSGRSPSARFVVSSVFNPDGTINMQALFASQVTMRIHENIGREARAAAQFGIGGNRAAAYSLPGTLPKVGALRHLGDMLQSPTWADPAKKTMMLDTESASLLREHGIWQLAYNISQGNAPLDPTITDLRFRNPYMQRTAVQTPTGVKNLEEYLSGTDIMDPTEGMLKFFGDVKGVDVIAGHNLSFDVNMIITQATSLPAYKANTDIGKSLRAGVKGFISKVYDADTGTIQPTMLDTLELARSMYGPSITGAAEVAGTYKEAQTFNMQNILLQSNLVQRAREMFSPELVKGAMAAGSHQAQADVMFQTALHRAMIEQLTGTGPGLQFGDHFLTAAEREVFTKSRAMGPFFNMGSMEEVAPSLRHRLESRGLKDSHGRPLLTPLEQDIILDREGKFAVGPLGNSSLFMPRTTSFKELWEDAKSNGASVWQRIRKTFWDAPYDLKSDIHDLGFQAGSWRRLSAGGEHPFVDSRGALSGIPNMEEYHKLQKVWRDRGIPFSGMSYYERHISATLATLNTGSDRESLVGRIFGGEIAPVARWMSQDHIGVIDSGAKQVLRMPEWVTNEMMAAGQKIGLFQSKLQSGFYQPDLINSKRGKEIGLKVGFSPGDQGEREREFLANFLEGKLGDEEYKNLGLTTDVLGEIRGSFDKGAADYGIQVGTIAAFKNPEAAETGFHVIEQAVGRSVFGTDQTPQIYLAKVAQEDRGKIVTAGALMRPDMMEERDLAAIPMHAQRAFELSQDGLHTNSRLMNFFETLATKNKMGEETQVAKRMYDSVWMLKRRAPLIAAGAAVVGAGYYVYRKEKKANSYDQTLAQQPYEEPGWYSDYQRSMGGSGPVYPSSVGRQAQRRTGGITGILDRNKSRHSMMGNNKYSYLYGGSY